MSQFFTTVEEIHNWLLLKGIKNFTIDDDLLVDVDGGVDLEADHVELLPVRFNIVAGHCDLDSCHLKSLLGSPRQP